MIIFQKQDELQKNKKTYTCIPIQIPHYSSINTAECVQNSKKTSSIFVIT